MLKKTIISVAALLSAGGAAFAADLPMRKEAPAYVAPMPVFTWSGAYFGLNAGGVFTKNAHSMAGQSAATQAAINAGLVPASMSKDKSGFIGGVQAGYNWQTGAWVLGVEADVNYVGAKSTASFVNPLGDVVSARSDLRWLGTGRLRAGYAFDRFLVYATGGVAFGDVKQTAGYWSAGVPLYYGSKSEMRAGWTLGGGVEYAITNNVTVKGEYLYYDLGKSTVSVDPVGVAGASYAARVKNDGHIVRAGLNWKF
jgi:outer membrane immunogenic protein